MTKFLKALFSSIKDIIHQRRNPLSPTQKPSAETDSNKTNYNISEIGYDRETMGSKLSDKNVFETEQGSENIEVNIEHYENPKNSMIENSLKTEKREMTFSLTQSNILLYLLFILGSAVCILGELSILGLRESTPSTMLKAILVILPINILLWLDFNFMASSSIVKRHMVLFQISKLLDSYYKVSQRMPLFALFFSPSFGFKNKKRYELRMRIF